jgi:Mrp family chromosome partitioning ATPase
VILASQVDGVVFVVSAGETSREACKLAIQRLLGAGGRMLGVVLQKAELRELPDYFHRYYKRSYAYGEPGARPSLTNR